MGDEGNSATAGKVLGEGIVKSWVAVIRIDIIKLGGRDSVASLDFMLGVAVASSQRERERERWFKRQRDCSKKRCCTLIRSTPMLLIQQEPIERSTIVPRTLNLMSMDGEWQRPFYIPVSAPSSTVIIFASEPRRPRRGSASQQSSLSKPQPNRHL